MYIISKTHYDGTEEIINIIHDDENAVCQWIKEYLEAEKTSLQMCPVEKGIKNIEYMVESQSNSHNNVLQHTLVKEYKQIAKGYVYNSYHPQRQVVCTVKALIFSGINNLTHSKGNLWNNVNEEINSRVIKQMDHASLCQLWNTVNQQLDTKETWNKQEFTFMVSHALKDFRKELFSSIAKKMRKFGKSAVPLPIAKPESNYQIERNLGKHCKVIIKKKLD